MKFISLINNYRSALAVAERAVGRSTHLPILGYFLLEADKNKIKVSATNLDIAITTEFSGKIEEPGRVTIPARTMLSFLSNLSDGKLEGASSGSMLKISTESYQASFQASDPEEFPIIPKLKQTEPVKFASPLLKKSLEQVITAAGVSDIKPELSAVLFRYEPGEALKLVATDGFRLAEKTVPGNQFSSQIGEKMNKLIPLRSAEEILKISQEKTGEVEILFDENQALFSWPDTQLFSRLLEGEFPEYTSAIPTNFASQCLVDKKKFIEGLKVCGVFASKLNDVRITTSPKEGQMSLKASDPSVGENEAQIQAQISGKPTEVSFNYKYLIDGLEQLAPGQAFFGLGDATSPALLKSEGNPDYLYILAPLRL